MIKKKNEKCAQDLIIALTKSWIIKNIDKVPINKYANEYMVIKSNVDIVVQGDYSIQSKPDNKSGLDYYFNNLYPRYPQPESLDKINYTNFMDYALPSNNPLYIARSSNIELAKNEIYVLPKFSQINFLPGTIDLLYTIKLDTDFLASVLTTNDYVVTVSMTTDQDTTSWGDTVFYSTSTAYTCPNRKWHCLSF